MLKCLQFDLTIPGVKDLYNATEYQLRQMIIRNKELTWAASVLGLSDKSDIELAECHIGQLCNKLWFSKPYEIVSDRPDGITIKAIAAEFRRRASLPEANVSLLRVHYNVFANEAKEYMSRREGCAESSYYSTPKETHYLVEILEFSDTT